MRKLNRTSVTVALIILSVSCLNANPSNTDRFEDNVSKSAYPEPAEIGTWSIVAVDYETGQIGIAGASCTFNVQGIGQVIPGKGAVIVQGMSSDEAMERAMELLQEDTNLEQILKEIRNPEFDPENQQYAIISIDSTITPVAYTGSDLDESRGERIARGVTVQGNVLVSEETLDNTLRVFQNTSGALVEKLVRALEAGASAGGDKRCGDQKARSAFVTVYKKTDNARWPYFHLVVYGNDKGGVPAVEYLVKEFQSLYPKSKNRPTTRVYITPEQ
jgi:uncharacterized Ntn-hydrolase superfamily protein